MREVHVCSGGRYPVLRSLAILYMVGALIVMLLMPREQRPWNST